MLVVLTFTNSFIQHQIKVLKLKLMRNEVWIWNSLFHFFSHKFWLWYADFWALFTVNSPFMSFMSKALDHAVLFDLWLKNTEDQGFEGKRWVSKVLWTRKVDRFYCSMLVTIKSWATSFESPRPEKYEVSVSIFNYFKHIVFIKNDFHLVHKTSAIN